MANDTFHHPSVNLSFHNIAKIEIGTVQNLVTSDGKRMWHSVIIRLYDRKGIYFQSVAFHTDDNDKIEIVNANLE